ncbi:cytochrome c-type biogenesis protein CcmI [Pseudidiomarina planktonica]|uniref:Cytochrome c-type biogenesis protein CcmI n=1 Tax=Pseudidiomarina planktonica TaxID=1323738 RepID=A0A1Y6EJ19_9GAMM|nr:c-type cytochrome biogenesis protein CcmI [Pseudidiomarina planktonica]SMQ62628.1 cytochrome c-type biogenesis protein CcmI [Pseudidiomarina planktonica]
MIANWLILALVLLLGGAFLLVFGRRQSDIKRTRLTVNRELYQQRIQELENEAKDGVLSKSALAAAKTELDKRFVNENAELEQKLETSQPVKLWVVALLVMVIASGVYYGSGSWRLQLQADDALLALPELGRRALQNDQEQLTPRELDTFALGLRQKLARQPNDAVAWLVYGRVMLAQGQMEQAIDAMQRSYDLQPDRMGTLLSFSQLLLSTGEPRYLAQAAELLVQALQQNPQSPDALSLLGFVAYEQQDWQEAVTAWQLLLEQLEPGDGRYAVIEEALSDARQRLAGADTAIRVTVDLAPELQAAVPEGATLFVYVRDPDGNPMPAAVVKQPVTEFPVTVTLSDADAMLADYTLSSLEQWQVLARISADERIDASPGDLDGRSEVITTITNETLNVTINNRINDGR